MLLPARVQIIDEVSMVGHDMVEFADFVFCVVRCVQQLAACCLFMAAHDSHTWSIMLSWMCACI